MRGKFVAIAAAAGSALACSAFAQAPGSGQSFSSILGDATSTVSDRSSARPPARAQKKPLARLIRNPDESDGMPAYALADQTGAIQRFVEPVPGIDLEPYVGYAVIVKHDTGRTLLASQLELPGPDYELPAEEPARTGGGVNALFHGILDSSTAPNGVQPAQYVPGTQYGPGPGTQYVPGNMAPVVIQDGMPPMMGPQGVVTYDPMDPNMGAVPWQTMQPGAGPVYLDGPGAGACGPQGCQTCPTPVPYMPQPVPCAPPLPPPPPPLVWSLWGEVLWLHPTGVDMAHAQQQDGIGGAGTVPFGLIGVVDPDYELGFRVGGEARIGPKDAVFASYTWFESDAASSLVAPVIPGGGGAVGSLVHHPGAALTASIGPVDATYNIDFQLAEAAYRYFVLCSRTGEASVFLGARYGNLEQSFLQQGIFGGGAGGAIDTSTNIEFDGAGPIAGAAGEHTIGVTRFSVYGRTSAAALTGSFRSHYRMFNATAQALLAEAIWEDDRIVPMLDYELGLAWTSPQSHLRLAAGYMASYWFNAVTTPVFVDAVQADNYVDIADTIAFDGLVGRVEFRW